MIILTKVAVPQVKEILSNYGKFPAVLWWDTPNDMNRERAAESSTMWWSSCGRISL